MRGDRGNLDAHCQEIAERMLPMYSRSFNSMNGSKGDKRNEKIFDSTPAVALGRGAAILDSLLTPRNSQWHRLQASDPLLNKNRQVRLYFEEATRILFAQRYAPTANFASQNLQDYQALLGFGTGCLFIDEFFGRPGLRYRAIHLGEFYIRENHQGVVDAVMRHFPMTLRQAYKKWGEKLPDTLKSKLKQSPDTEYFFLHCVKPREGYDPERLDYRGMPFASYYVSLEGKKLLEEGGYMEFPYAVSRYNQAPGEAYGRSPAMDILPAVKTLNEQAKTLLKQGHRAVDPILLAHDDGVADAFSWKPGSINAGGISADGRALIQALPAGRVDIGKELMDDQRAIINDAFFVTLFQILVDTPQMSATEVIERTREKGILIAPTVGRLQSERQGPQIVRELDVLSRQIGVNGKPILPPMPEILKEAKGDYKIEYDSPLSRMARAEETAGLSRTLQMALEAVNITQDPTPMFHFNWDAIIPEVADNNAVPARWMNDPKVVEQMKAARAAQAQADAENQAAPGMAALIKAEAQAGKNAGKGKR